MVRALFMNGKREFYDKWSLLAKSNLFMIGRTSLVKSRV
jgi:hypothetical protein